MINKAPTLITRKPTVPINSETVSIRFAKMVASGNDFVVTEVKIKKLKGKNSKTLAREICDRKYGVGADGFLILEKVKKASIRMRIFNADGTEAEMCGNGARCAALYSTPNLQVPSPEFNIMTKAGVIQAIVNKDTVRIKLTKPKALRLDLPIKVNGRLMKVNFLNTGVPHAVIFVEGLEKIDLPCLGSAIRYHAQFKPAGTNVDFVEILNDNSIRIRTYERGVEGETLSCGTGSVASALVTTCHLSLSASGSISVHTQGGEILKVYYKKEGIDFGDVWLEGKASIVYKGVYHV